MRKLEARNDRIGEADLQKNAFFVELGHELRKGVGSITSNTPLYPRLGSMLAGGLGLYALVGGLITLIGWFWPKKEFPGNPDQVRVEEAA